MGTLVGTFRRFGQFGPAYEVLARGNDGRDGEPRLRIRLIETGEEAEHAVRHALTDPIED